MEEKDEDEQKISSNGYAVPKVTGLDGATALRLNDWAAVNTNYLDQTTRLVSGVMNSPSMVLAQDALRATVKLGNEMSSLVQISARPLSEMVQVSSRLAEPLFAIQRNVSMLNSISAEVAIPPSYITTLTGGALARPFGNLSPGSSMVIDTGGKPWVQPSDGIAVMKDVVNQLAARLEGKIEEIVNTALDKLVKSGILPSGIKNALCYCKHCDRMLFKVQSMSEFMVGTQKCGCGKMVHIPDDLKIVEVDSKD